MSAVDRAPSSTSPHGGPARSRPGRGSSCSSTPARFRPMRSAVGDGVLAGSGRVARPRRCCAWAQDGTPQGRLAGRAPAARRSRARSRRADGARRAGRRLPALGRRAAAGGRRGARRLRGDLPRPGRSRRVPQISVVSGPCAGGAAYSPALGDLDGHGRPEARDVPHRARDRRARHARGVTRRGARRPAGARRATASRTSIADDDVAGRRARPRRCSRTCPRARAAPLPLVAAARRRRPATPATSLPERDRAGLRRARRRRAARRRRRAARARAALGAQPRRRLRAASRARRSASSPTSRATSAAASTPTRPRRARGSSSSATASALPLVVLVDTPGFLPGAAPGARRASSATAPALLRAFATRHRARASRVTLRQAYGGAHIVMNSRDLGADLTLAWPRCADRRHGRAPGRRARPPPRHRRGRRRRRAGRRLRGRAPAGARRGRAAGFVDEVVAPARDARARSAFALEAGR